MKKFRCVVLKVDFPGSFGRLAGSRGINRTGTKRSICSPAGSPLSRGSDSHTDSVGASVSAMVPMSAAPARGKSQKFIVGGLTEKKVTIAVINMRGFLAELRADGEAAVRAHSQLLEALGRAA